MCFVCLPYIPKLWFSQDTQYLYNLFTVIFSFFQASSPPLCAVILSGILLASLTTFTFIARPSRLSCCLSIYGFLISISVIYAPVLVKTNRVYRIFSAGKRGHKKTKFIGSKSMIIFTTILILGQVNIYYRPFIVIIQDIMGPTNSFFAWIWTEIVSLTIKWCVSRSIYLMTLISDFDFSMKVFLL